MIRKLVKKILGRDSDPSPEKPEDPIGRARFMFVFGDTFHSLGTAALMKGQDEQGRLALVEHCRTAISDLQTKLLDEPLPPPKCDECGGYGYGYMLKNEVWEAISLPHERFLCLPCAEVRHDRPFVRSDFAKECRINDPLFYAIDVVDEDLEDARPPETSNPCECDDPPLQARAATWALVLKDLRHSRDRGAESLLHPHPSASASEANLCRAWIAGADEVHSLLDVIALGPDEAIAGVKALLSRTPADVDPLARLKMAWWAGAMEALNVSLVGDLVEYRPVEDSD